MVNAKRKAGKTAFKVTVFNRQKDLKISSAAVKKLVRALIEKMDVACEEIIVHFVSQKKICALHAQFFNDPSPTDCITFPMDKKLLGEIFVCPKAAIDYGTEPYLETTLYIVHGLLHLLGYDDIDPKDRQKMRKKEKWCLNFLNENQIKLDIW